MFSRHHSVVPEEFGIAYNGAIRFGNLEQKNLRRAVPAGIEHDEYWQNFYTNPLYTLIGNRCPMHSKAEVRHRSEWKHSNWHDTHRPASCTEIAQVLWSAIARKAFPAKMLPNKHPKNPITTSSWRSERFLPIHGPAELPMDRANVSRNKWFKGESIFALESTVIPWWQKYRTPANIATTSKRPTITDIFLKYFEITSIDVDSLTITRGISKPHSDPVDCSYTPWIEIFI